MSIADGIIIALVIVCLGLTWFVRRRRKQQGKDCCGCSHCNGCKGNKNAPPK